MVNTKLGLNVLQLFSRQRLQKQIVKTEENEPSNCFIWLDFS